MSPSDKTPSSNSTQAVDTAQTETPTSTSKNTTTNTKPAATNNSSTTQPTTPTAPKSWVVVAQLSGSSEKRSDTFHLGGGKTRLTYTFNGGEALAGIIYVLKEGVSLETSGGIPEVMVQQAGTDSTFLAKKAGNYYLDVKSANATWSVKIEEEK